MTGKRVETGNIRFGDDWAGVVIRGDNAFMYVMSLRQLMAGSHDAFVLAQVQGLVDLLSGCIEPTTSEVQLLKPFPDCKVTLVEIEQSPK